MATYKSKYFFNFSDFPMDTSTNTYVCVYLTDSFTCTANPYTLISVTVRKYCDISMRM